MILGTKIQKTKFNSDKDQFLLCDSKKATVQQDGWTSDLAEVFVKIKEREHQIDYMLYKSKVWYHCALKNLLKKFIKR